MHDANMKYTRNLVKGKRCMCACIFIDVHFHLIAESWWNMSHLRRRLVCPHCSWTRWCSRLAVEQHACKWDPQGAQTLRPASQALRVRAHRDTEILVRTMRFWREGERGRRCKHAYSGCENIATQTNSSHVDAVLTQVKALSQNLWSRGSQAWDWRWSQCSTALFHATQIDIVSSILQRLQFPWVLAMRDCTRCQNASMLWRHFFAFCVPEEAALCPGSPEVEICRWSAKKDGLSHYHRRGILEKCVASVQGGREIPDTHRKNLLVVATILEAPESLAKKLDRRKEVVLSRIEKHSWRESRSVHTRYCARKESTLALYLARSTCSIPCALSWYNSSGLGDFGASSPNSS